MARTSVEELKKSMGLKKIELQGKKKDCSTILGQIERDKRETEKERKRIEEKEAIITKEKNETLKLTEQAESQL